MFNVKIRINSYTSSGNFRTLNESGEIEVSAEVDVLSEDYKKIKLQVNELLEKVNAENRLVLDVSQLEKEVENKQRTLKNLEGDIRRATAQLDRLRAFLKRLGINPDDYALEISSFSDESHSSGEMVAVEVKEVDALPFNENTNTAL